MYHDFSAVVGMERQWPIMNEEMVRVGGRPTHSFFMDAFNECTDRTSINFISKSHKNRILPRFLIFCNHNQ